MKRFIRISMMFGTLCLYIAVALVATAETTGSVHARPLVTGPVVESQLVTLVGNTRPLAKYGKADRGAVSDELAMPHMWLQLKRAPEQQAALDQLVEQLHKPGSPNYHQWLTPAEFGQTFGVATSDIAKVTGWLQSHGMTVNHVYANGTLIDFSGTAGQVREAFHTEIHNIVAADGRMHIANISDPKIPAALAPVVTGVVRLHDFAPRPMSVASGSVSKNMSTGKVSRVSSTAGGTASNGQAASGPKADFSVTCPVIDCGYQQTLNIVAPGDFATIYNELPLLTASQPITGAGQTIVTLEDSDMQLADVATFRQAFLPTGYTGTFALAHPGCTDPGTSPDEIEAAIDAEWAGALAPNANVISASCTSTNVAFGGLIALENLLNTAGSASIYSLSFGECESDLGYAENAALNATYQQAAAQGASVYVASGNTGGDSCDGDGASYSTSGLSVNGFASTPYNVAVGGTDFSDTYAGTSTNYWNATDASLYSSAKSYIPEVPWNDSCANQLNYSYQGYASGENFCNSGGGERSFLNTGASAGGPSALYSKPSYQAGFAGIQNDGLRDLPDISLFSSGGVWSQSLAYCMSDAKQGGVQCGYADTQQLIFNIGGGTAFASSAMAAIQALINQKAGEPQGDPNYFLYGLAAATYGSAGSPGCSATKGNQIASSCVFHDVTSGDNAVPCLTGSTNCLTSTTEHAYGVLSADGVTPAFQATTGWDFATGIGTPNVANLVNSWGGLTAGTPTMTITVAPNSVVKGSTVKVTATVSGQGSYPTGTIKFTASEGTVALGSATLPVVPTTAPACASTCQNSVSFSIALPSSLGLGEYTVTAAFAPTSGQYKATTATTNFYIASGATSTTLAALAYNGGGANSVVTTVSYSGSTAPTGSIALVATDTTTGAVSSLGSFSVSGNGSTCAASAPSASTGLLTCVLNYQPPYGSYSVVAVYSGDINYVSSTSAAQPLADVEFTTTPQLSISPAVVTPGNPTPTFSIVLPGTLATQYELPYAPTGTVTLSGSNGLNTFASIPTSACKTITTGGGVPPEVVCTLSYHDMWNLWGNGTYQITATFHGTGYYADNVATSAAQTLTISTGSASSTVLTLSGNGSYAAGATVTATLVSTGVSGKGAPTGLVTITPTGLGLPVSFTLPTGCTATNSYTTTCVYQFTIPITTQPGPLTAVASYVGDASYNPSTSSVPIFILPSISFTAATHDFGSVAIGNKVTWVVGVTNNMTVPFSWRPGTYGSTEFVMTDNCGATIAAGATCQASFTFTPTTAASATGNWAVGAGTNITFWPSDGGILTGLGTASAGVTLASSGHNFGPQAIGSISQVYGNVLTNGMQDPLALTITVSGNTVDFTTFATNCGATLKANSSCQLQYQFTPQAKGAEAETVSITAVDTVTNKPVTITAGGVTVSGITLSGTGQ